MKQQSKILIVDDEPVNRELLEALLWSQQHHVIAAESGLEALQKVQEETPDLILMDVMMKGMTGIEAVRRLKSNEQTRFIPVVMVTALDDVADRVAALDAGADDFLSKPVQPTELRARVTSLLKVKAYYDHLRSYQNQLEMEVEVRTGRLQALLTSSDRFVPREFLSLLGRQSIVEVELGDQVKKEITILFSDIRQFTTLSESITPEENFKFLNSYLSQMEPIVNAHRGFIDKYLGDGIMALFPVCADDAVQCGIAMRQRLVVYNEGRARAGYRAIEIGIGINTGPAILGTIGGKNRIDGTVISDAVNLAARVEALTKLYRTQLLISEATYEQLQDASRYACRIVDCVKVVGKSESVTIYEMLTGDTPDRIANRRQTHDDFQNGLVRYQAQRFAEAEEVFQGVLEIDTDDAVALLYVARCQKFREYGPPENWDGVTMFEHKTGTDE